jgi:hypothetical protein
MARNTLECSANIGEETLSAWRDELLSPQEMARIREHAPTCQACQQRLGGFEMVAAALLRQRDIEPGDRVLAGVRQQTPGGRPLRLLQRRGPPAVMTRRVWSGVGALAAVAALVLLFVYVFGGIAGRVTNPGHGKTPVVTQPISPAPTLPPAPVPSKAVDALTAWGPTAATTISTRIDATHIMEVGGITPDGRDLLGYSITLTANGQVDQHTPAEAGFMDITTRKFTSIGLTDSVLYSHNCCTADGHYLLMAQDTAPGATCGLCHLTYWSYDMNAGQKYEVARGTDFQMVESAFLSNGMLVLGTGDGVKVANLATHALTSISQIPASAQVASVSWPYVLYRTQDAVPQTHLFNLSTNRDAVIAQLDPGYVAPSSVLLAGDAIYVVVEQPSLLETPTSLPGTATASFPGALYELDGVTNPAATLRAVATYKDQLVVSNANARLVLFSGPDGPVWDRAEQRFVRLGTFLALSGSYLVTNTSGAAGTGSVPASVDIYDTATLPVRTGG